VSYVLYNKLNSGEWLMAWTTEHKNTIRRAMDYNVTLSSVRLTVAVEKK
jgi:hypothetical protein